MFAHFNVVVLSLKKMQYQGIFLFYLADKSLHIIIISSIAKEKLLLLLGQELMPDLLVFGIFLYSYPILSL